VRHGARPLDENGKRAVGHRVRQTRALPDVLPSGTPKTGFPRRSPRMLPLAQANTGTWTDQVHPAVAGENRVGKFRRVLQQKSQRLLPQSLRAASSCRRPRRPSPAGAVPKTVKQNAVV